MSELDEQIKSLEDKLSELKNKKEENLIPKQIINPDFAPLINQCNKYLEFILSEDFHDDNNYDHYIYETAIECIFGKDFFKWYNKRV